MKVPSLACVLGTPAHIHPLLHHHRAQLGCPTPAWALHASELGSTLWPVTPWSLLLTAHAPAQKLRFVSGAPDEGHLGCSQLGQLCQAALVTPERAAVQTLVLQGDCLPPGAASPFSEGPPVGAPALLHMRPAGTPPAGAPCARPPPPVWTLCGHLPSSFPWGTCVSKSSAHPPRAVALLTGCEFFVALGAAPFWLCHSAVVCLFSLSVRAKCHMSMKSHALTSSMHWASCHHQELTPRLLLS